MSATRDGVYLVGLERRRHQKNLIIIFKGKVSACFKAENLVTPNRRYLCRHGTSLKRLSDALLSTWTVIEIDSHMHGMLSATILANMDDIVCCHTWLRPG